MEIESALRDPEDRPVLRGALFYYSDYLLTGDKDLLELKIDKPLPITPRQFLDNY